MAEGSDGQIGLQLDIILVIRLELPFYVTVLLTFVISVFQPLLEKERSQSGGREWREMYSSNRGQQKQKKAFMKAIMAMVGLCIVGYIVGPPLYWHLSDLLAATLRSSSSSSSYDCPPCFCDCSSLPLLPQPDGLANSSFTECMKHEAEGNQEMDKGFIELVSEEVKLKEAEALENHHRADMALLEAKKVASQYQKEADKCNSGMETCEEAREKAQAALEAQRKLSAMWELRARQRGWKQVATSTSRTVAGRKF